MPEILYEFWVLLVDLKVMGDDSFSSLLAKGTEKGSYGSEEGTMRSS